MKNIKFRLLVQHFFLFVSILFFFNSCTIGGTCFFANESNKTVIFVQHFKGFNKIVYYYNQPNSDPKTILQEIKDPELTIYGMTNSDRKFNRRTHQYLDPVPFQIDSINQIIKITVPPKKAIQFDTHRNFSYNFSKKIQIKIDGRIHELEDLKLKYKSRGLGLVTRVIKYQG